MKDIVIVGDSFCANPHTWPAFLADQLNLNLVCYGVGGEHWWGVKTFLDTVNKSNVEVVVIAHTFGQRIPTIVKHNIDPTASELYYKHIHNEEFLTWAQEQWFKQVSQEWNIKLVNLHCFPWTWDKRNLLAGVNVSPNLAAISLNEVDAQEAVVDETVIAKGQSRTNHFNLDNNQALANELVRIIQDYKTGDIELDLTRFQQKTTRWLEWK